MTFEVIRHKLMAITEEQRITFQSVSGSPVVTEASDYYTGLFMSDGTIVTMGYKVVTQGGPMTLSIKKLQELFPLDSIGQGDVFLANDPYRAAVHQNDIQILVPLFYKEELVAWAGFGAHEVDVGGMDFASWCPKAKDVYQEGFRVAGLKIVEGGKVREDVWQFILSLTRLPHFLDLDMRGMIAAGHISQVRITEILDRYGTEVLEATMLRMLDYSEQKLRERLSAMPDGRFRAIDFLEHDGHQDRLYRISLTLTKQADSIDLDFTGSSDQAPGFINCTRAGMQAGLIGALFPSIAYDIPWNQGLLRPVTMNTRPGSICDAQFPAPVGAATVEAVWVVKNVVQFALAKLKGCTAGMESEVQAVSCGTMPTVNLGGIDQYGRRFGTHFLDPMMSGFGAYSDQDGYEVGGSYSTPVPCVANVESSEFLSPMLYLRRRLEPATPGVGEFRGGMAASISFTIHGVPSTEALIMTHGVEVPNGMGLFGGFPGSCVRQRLMTNSDLLERQRSGNAPVGIDELDGETEEMGPKPGLLELKPGDVFDLSLQGGGGMGDPLDRDPEFVAGDFAKGFFTAPFAERVYGVVFRDEGQFDEEATEALRKQMLRDRISSAQAPLHPHKGPVDCLQNRIGGRLYYSLYQGKTWFACSCRQPLARREGNWREGAGLYSLPPARRPIGYRLHPQLELRGFICPSCGGMLSVDVNEKDAPDYWDIELF